MHSGVYGVRLMLGRPHCLVPSLPRGLIAGVVPWPCLIIGPVRLADPKTKTVFHLSSEGRDGMWVCGSHLDSNAPRSCLCCCFMGHALKS